MSMINNNSSELLHIWDNAAFDCSDSVSFRNSWSNVDALLDKENHNVNQLTSPPSIANLKENELQIDMEIEDVQREIHRLSGRLLELKREKIEGHGMTGQRGGRVAFLELDKKQIISCGAVTRRMIRDQMNTSLTPLNHKSCFWKLDQIDELKMTKERGRTRLSLSPRASKPISKLPKQAATTVGSKKTVPKMNGRAIPSVLQPMKLFKEPVKKTAIKAGRVVASKYNKTGLRKRSLPENDESNGNEKKRASLGVDSCSKPVEQQGSRVKKKWEIPTDIVVYNSSTASSDDNDDDDDQTPRHDVLPRIGTARCSDETPRDSGAVKRAADKKSSSAFSGNNEQVCNALTFAEE